MAFSGCAINQVCNWHLLWSILIISFCANPSTGRLFLKTSISCRVLSHQSSDWLPLDFRVLKKEEKEALKDVSYLREWAEKFWIANESKSEWLKTSVHEIGGMEYHWNYQPVHSLNRCLTSKWPNQLICVLKLENLLNLNYRSHQMFPLTYLTHTIMRYLSSGNLDALFWRCAQ